MTDRFPGGPLSRALRLIFAPSCRKIERRRASVVTSLTPGVAFERTHCATRRPAKKSAPFVSPFVGGQRASNKTDTGQRPERARWNGSAHRSSRWAAIRHSGRPLLCAGANLSGRRGQARGETSSGRFAIDTPVARGTIGAPSLAGRPPPAPFDTQMTDGAGCRPGARRWPTLEAHQDPANDAIAVMPPGSFQCCREKNPRALFNGSAVAMGIFLGSGKHEDGWAPFLLLVRSLPAKATCKHSASASPAHSGDPRAPSWPRVESIAPATRGGPEERAFDQTRVLQSKPRSVAESASIVVKVHSDGTARNGSARIFTARVVALPVDYECARCSASPTSRTGLHLHERSGRDAKKGDTTPSTINTRATSNCQGFRATPPVKSSRTRGGGRTTRAARFQFDRRGMSRVARHRYNGRLITRADPCPGPPIRCPDARRFVCLRAGAIRLCPAPALPPGERIDRPAR